MAEKKRSCAVGMIILALAVACAPNDETSLAGTDGVQVLRDTVDGIERITSVGEAPRWTAQPILSLGSLGGTGEPTEDEFAWVSAVTVGPDELLYVADLGNDRVVAFDTTGARRREIGREGEGPGEFRSLYSIAWLGADLATLDLQNGRMGMIAPNGDWVRQTRSPGRLVASPVTHRLYQVGERELYEWGYSERDGIMEPAWRRHDTDGRTFEWPRDLPMPESPFPDKVVCTMGRGFSWFDHPFAIRMLGHPAPGNHALRAVTDVYRIAVVDSVGDTVRVVVREVEPPLLTDGAWLPVARRFEEWLEDKDRSACQPRGLERPTRKPVIESLMVDVGGRLWVERNLETGTLWEIFDVDGGLVGSVEGFEHDRQRTVPYLSRDHVAWVTRGDFDAPLVHWARLHEAPR